MDVFSVLVTLKDHLLKSLCIHVLVSIIKSMTISTSIALAGFRFPVHLKHMELLKLELDRDTSISFFCLFPLMLAMCFKKHVLKDSSKHTHLLLHQTIILEPKVHHDLPEHNYWMWKNVSILAPHLRNFSCIFFPHNFEMGKGVSL